METHSIDPSAFTGKVFKVRHILSNMLIIKIITYSIIMIDILID